jgi:serine/threonine protein kinase
VEVLIMSLPPRFTLQEDAIGAGGFAKVIRGRDNVLERDIAVKVLDPLATAFSESDQERFRREARILARLAHPNIPAIYDVDLAPGKFSIIFQYIEGANLRQIMTKEGPCQLSDARVWFHQIASALEYAHSLGIIHRDVKPDNIVITPDRESAYLVDFGIALTADEARKLTQSGFVVGTPGYMSPEQQGGEEIDKSTDVYSLAVTLYEALAGKPIPIGDYEELSLANEAIPPQIDELVRDCLLPKARRIESARAFSVRLSGALRATKPLSDVLAHGKLHELAAALEELSPEDFMKLPEGQRVLILAKVTDVVASGETRLQIASEQFLNLLLSRGLLLDKESYREIVRPSLDWAFEKTSGEGYVGSRSIQRSLEEAAHSARGIPHEVIREEFIEFLKGVELDRKENWYLQEIRDLLETLLANPSCTTGALELATVLKQINHVQRARPRTLSRSAGLF